MKMSRRAKRMAQHHVRHKRTTSLNMVSLMDIFTILVFFLLVNASEVELITPPKGVELPESSAQAKPEQVLSITVSAKAIMVNDQTVTAVTSKLLAEEGAVAAITSALEDQDIDSSTQLTVLADKNIEYQLIKRILLSCTAAGFENIALAVLQKAEQPS